MTKHATMPGPGDDPDDLPPGFAEAFRHIGGAAGATPGAIATALLVQGVSHLVDAHGYGRAAEMLRRLAEITSAERRLALQ
ncbi:MAG: hypothetical protein FJX67_14315 [Alphaproteobacteria bacterium]|nr:hypothetical protein [Alphaproteobacteria bacterium]